MANPLSVTLQASAAQTAGGSSTPVDAGALRKAARLRLEVTAISGTNPALTVTIETGPSSTGPWRSLSGWSVSAVQSVERMFGETDRYLRVTWSIAGTDTPSVTFSVAGTAHVLYAAPSDVVALSIVGGALASVPIEERLEACLAGTAQADDYLNAGYTLPLTAWGASLTKHAAALSVLQLLDKRGWQPEGPDQRLQVIEEQAHRWLRDVAAGRLRPPDITDSTPTTFEAGAYVVSSARRGW